MAHQVNGTNPGNHWAPQPAIQAHHHPPADLHQLQDLASLTGEWTPAPQPPQPNSLPRQGLVQPPEASTRPRTPWAP